MPGCGAFPYILRAFSAKWDTRANIARSPHDGRRSGRRDRTQCDISTGTVIDDSISCVTPPQTSAVIRGRL